MEIIQGFTWGVYFVEKAHSIVGRLIINFLLGILLIMRLSL